MSKNNPRTKAFLDSENYRFIISPLDKDGGMKIPAVFRAIMQTTNTTWKDLAAFAGLKNQNEAFRVAYTNDRLLINSLVQNMAIDVSNRAAYFYDKDHKPAAIPPQVPAPTITNKEAATQTVTAFVPTKVVSRVTVNDDTVRVLKMSITPTNGYLLGIRDIHLSNPGMTYVVRATASTLNTLLKNIHFIGVEPDAADVTIAIEDITSTGTPTFTVSTTVQIAVAAGTVPSIPELIVPETAPATLNNDVKIDGIEVKDTDGKIMELRVQPFNCEVLGFKSIIRPLLPGQVQSVFGRPDTINEAISDLQVRARKLNAQLAFELVCGSTKIRKYTIFDVADDPAASTTPGGASGSGTAPAVPGGTGSSSSTGGSAAPAENTTTHPSTGYDRPSAPVVMDPPVPPTSSDTDDQSTTEEELDEQSLEEATRPDADK